MSYKAQPLVAGGPNIVEGVYSRAGETVRFGDQPVPMTFAANTVVIQFGVVQFLPYRPDQPIVLGVILVFAAAGLIGYYLSARRLVAPTQGGSAAVR